MPESEFLRLKRQIEDEYQAAKRGLEGVAVTASHEFITARMNNIGACHERLITLVGPEEAGKVMVETPGV